MATLAPQKSSSGASASNGTSSEAAATSLKRKSGAQTTTKSNGSTTKKKKPKPSTVPTGGGGRGGFTSNGAMPQGIDGILRWMGQQDGKKYLEKQADSRGGCSKTRNKLRKYAEENHGHSAVIFYQQTSKWHPRNEEELNAIVSLLKNGCKRCGLKANDGVLA